MAPDEWQLTVLRAWMGVRSDGKWAASRCGLAVPRQNGKNAVLEMRELFGMIVLGEKFVHTAHEVKTARKAFLRLKSFFENKRRYPELVGLVQDIRQTNGQEAIVLTTGGSCEFVARSKGSARGFTVDVLVMDEAQELTDDALEALLPTISAGPLQNPQQIFTGTPPGPSASGAIFTRLRADGVAGKDRRLAWHEWSCEPGADLDSVEALAQANPALGIRLQREVAEAERQSLSDGGYARERLGTWASDTVQQVIQATLWGTLAVAGEDAPAQDLPPSALAADMSHDRVVAISGCWLDPETDTSHVELLAVDQVMDTAGAVEWLVERAGRRIPVVIDEYSPAAEMIPSLRARRVKVIVSRSPDMAKACSGFYGDAVATPARLSHADQAQLNDALAGARKRKIGDAGGWGWDRRDPSVNIAPLVSVTLARFGAVVNRPKVGNSRRVVVLS